MTKTPPLRLALAAIAVCSGATCAQAQADAPWVADARQVATSVPPKLLAVLESEIDKGGPEGAIGACRDQAPAMARAASEKTGWAIRRVSLRNRNPKAVPDAWERAALEDFDRRTAAHEPPAKLERAEVVQEDGKAVQRYIRALPTQPLCTNCHGSAAEMKPGVKARLAELYPQDKATGYEVGQIRGAITLKRPAP